MTIPEPMGPQKPSPMPLGRYRAVPADRPARPHLAATPPSPQAPRWLSTDLRDGNQALIDPMSPARKMTMFDLLVRMGYKEIEVGFPSASETDFAFVRQLIESDRIPDDVTISVLTQAREDLIERSVQSLVGVPRANIHLYNALAPLFRRVVFRASKDEIKDIAVRGTQIVMKNIESYLDTTVIGYEYSPEIFTGTELPFSVEVCEAVSDVWQPDDGREIILNLPATVEMATPNVYADQIEWFSRQLTRRAEHRDQPAPPQRPRYGGRRDRARDDGRRRPGRGLPVRPRRAHRQRRPGHPGDEPVQPGHRPDGRHLRHRRDPPHRRVLHPAAGPPAAPLRRRPRLHGVLRLPPGRDQEGPRGPRARRPPSRASRSSSCPWEAPYLPIDPHDVGRTYEAVIRVNSQSGKGGVAYILKAEHKLDLPRRAQIEFSRVIQEHTDAEGGEMTPDEIWRVFRAEYLDRETPLKLNSVHTSSAAGEKDALDVNVYVDGEIQSAARRGQRPDRGVRDRDQRARQQDFDVRVLDYAEHALSSGGDAVAAAYVECLVRDTIYWGVGIDANIVTASLKAVISAVNRAGRPATPRRQ